MCDQGNSREAEKRRYIPRLSASDQKCWGIIYAPPWDGTWLSSRSAPPSSSSRSFPDSFFLKKHISWREVHIYYPAEEEEEKEGEPGNTASPGGAETVEFM